MIYETELALWRVDARLTMLELSYFCDVEEERIVMATAGVRPVVDLKLTLCRWDGIRQKLRAISRLSS